MKHAPCLVWNSAFLFVAFGVLSNCSVQADLLLEGVVGEVKSAEALFNDLDVKVNFKRESGKGRAKLDTSSNPNFQPVLNTTSSIWSVSQSGMYRSQAHFNMEEMDGDERVHERLKMFDGEVTRVLKDDAIANITQGLKSDKDFVRPHTLLVKRPFYYMSLSTLLSGTDVLLSSPQSEWPADHSVDYAYHGLSVVQDLDCDHITITLSVSNKPRMEIDLFLAKQRNLIPAKVVWRSLPVSKETPVEVGKVLDWIEIAPGIWFPQDAELISYNPVQIKFVGNQVPQWTDTYHVESVSITPNYDRSFFQDIEIPDGTAVYEVEGDQITKSYRKGGPKTVASEPVSNRFYFVTINVIIFALLALGYLIHSVRKKTTSVS